MNRNVARGRETREQLIRVATRLFAAHGYDGTSIEAVLQETGASRGSLYHHFPGKEALFLAVLQDLEARVVAEVAGSVEGKTDPVEVLGVACLSWIRMAGDTEVQQIVLIDAPAVLGWQRWRELDEENVLGQFRMAIAAAAEMGRLDPRHVDVFAHLVVAAVNEAAILVARSSDPAAALPGAQDAFEEFLRRLLG
ncbi:TetR/AcrR family transcriptional regulator [Actinoplanes sp. NPDC051513]|uniref:TetR/AcrR family transcriptional regulator n=1 Tax=Actinoplanes sp. NPDC051513 TaxID=3363908 RepID=UPI0037B3FF31